MVLLFVRFAGPGGGPPADTNAREAGEVLSGAIREADLPGRIADDTFCILLAGDARGAEVTVLSRLVEAIAAHDTARPDPASLEISVGSAIYDPANPVPLEALLGTARTAMRPHRSTAP